MSNCNYHLMNDGFDMIEAKLGELAEIIEAIELSVDIDSLDIDLDNLELQLTIANKLHFLDAVGTDIMTEEEQLAAYQSIKELIFTPTMGSSDSLIEEEGQL